MATVVNDRDVLIMGTTPRYTPPTDRGMFLTPPAAVFKLSADGLTASPSSFQFVATLLNMTGNVTWSTTGGISLSVNGNTATLNFASFTAVSGTITASITVDGQTFTQVATVTKLADGAKGQQGGRGNVDISAVTSGSIWSDSEAVAALAAAGYGAPQVRDLVNLYRADRTFSAQRMYNGSAWIAVGYVWNGNVFVKGSILPEAIDTRGLTIRDAAGNVILSAGMSLAQQVSTNPNLLPRLSSWPSWGRYNGAALHVDTSYPSMNGEDAYLPPQPAGNYVAYESDKVGIAPSEWYTVSFTARTEANSPIVGSLKVNLYEDGGGINTPGLVVAPPGWDVNGGKGQRYTFTEQMPSWTNGTARLCVVNNGGDGRQPMRVWDVKVEKGKQQTAWCDNVITAANASTFIQAVSIGSAFIADAAITNAKIANLAVTNAKIDNLAVDNAKIANLAVDNAKIANLAVDNAKIANLAVDNAKIANLAVDNAKIADLAVSTLKLQGQAVTIPVSAFTAGSVSRAAAGQASTVQSAGISSSGAPIVITFSAVITFDPGSASSSSATVVLYRDGNAIVTLSVGYSAGPVSFSYTIQDTPGAGWHTYDMSLNYFLSASNRSIVLLETKR